MERVKPKVLGFAAAAFLAVVLVLAATAPAHAAAGSWRQDNTGWWYAYDNGGYARNGWEQVGGKWYHFDEEGYMQTGWLPLRVTGGNAWSYSYYTWYYLDDSGAMAEGWRYVNGSWYWLTPGSGEMKEGVWLRIDSSRYWLDFDSGAMATGWRQINGEWQWFDGSGLWHPNRWVKDGTGWWYQWADGTYPTGSWQLIGGQWYRFDGRGYMLEGWQSIDGDWYYLGTSGAMAKSRWIGDYYVDYDGRMLVDQWVGGYVSGDYYVDRDGRWVPWMTKDYVDPGSSPASAFEYEYAFYVYGNYVAKVVPGVIQLWPEDLAPEDDCGMGIYITGYKGSANEVVIPDQIGGIDVVYADFRGSQISSIGVGNASSLRTLKCREVGLGLISGDAKSLEYLDASHNKLSSIDLASFPALREADLSYNKLTALGGRSPKLEYLQCTENRLSSVDLSKYPLIEVAVVGYNPLVKLSGEAPNLKRLGCSNCQLKALDFSRYTSLEDLYCGFNELTALGVTSALPKLRYLECPGNKLTAIDLSLFPSLTELVAVENPLGNRAALERWAAQPGHTVYL